MSSVASRNPFALLDEAGDDAAPAKTTTAKAPTAPAPAAAPKKDNQKARAGPASRGGKYYQRGGARTGSGLKDGAGNPNQNGIEEAESVPKKFEGRGRGRGGGRGGARGGRRPFDRHSATGKTDSDKKIHQGWGGDDGKTELQAEAAASTDAAAESAAPANDWDGAPADNWGAAAEGGPTEGAEAEGDKPEGRPRRVEEEEDNTLTLDQYLAQKKESAIVPKLEARKPNEGNDDLWKDAVAIQKGGEEDAYFAGKAKSTPKARAKKEEKVYLEIDGRFERPSRGGRGRGGDRGDRGGRGRGGRGGGRGRGGANTGTPALNVDDEAAFPSLS